MSDIQVPQHYQKLSLDPWAIIDQDFPMEQRIGFYRGNVLKYLLRYQDKGLLDDLNKCQHYLQKLIETYKEKESING